MKQTPKSIYEFKKGDKITRIKPSKPIVKMGEEEFVDRNYIGTPFVFVGIANGCVYLKRIMSEQVKELMSFFTMMSGGNGDSLVHLELELFEEGWDFYIDPATLGDFDDEFSIKELEKQKDEALEREDYKEVDRLQKLISKKTNG
jgi:hypothetical protein